MRDDTLKHLMASGESDLRALGAMLDSEDFSDSIFGFTAQQAVEKCLKVWLICTTGKHERTHDIGYLLGELAAVGIEVNPYMHFVYLAQFAVRFRYEPYQSGPPLQRKQIVKNISALFEQVRPITNEHKEQSNLD